MEPSATGRRHRWRACGPGANVALVMLFVACASQPAEHQSAPPHARSDAKPSNSSGAISPGVTPSVPSSRHAAATPAAPPPLSPPTAYCDPEGDKRVVADETKRSPKPECPPPLEPADPATAPPGMPADCAGVGVMCPDGRVDAGAINGVLAARIHRHLAETEPGNFVFSPLALQLTLAKLMRTLDRASAERLAREQCLPEPPPPSYERELEEVVAHWKSLRPKGTRRGIDLDLETRAFGTAVPPELQAFETVSVDSSAPAGKERFERWASRTVHAPVKLPELTGNAVLTTAVAFEGDWEAVFWSGRTRHADFELPSGHYVSAPVYDGFSEGVRVLSNRGCVPGKQTLVGLPYVADDLIFLAHTGREELSQILSDRQLTYWFRSARPIPAIGFSLWVPQLSLLSVLDLRCCGLEWLAPRGVHLEHITRFATRHRARAPRRRVSMPAYDSLLDGAAVRRAFLFWVRSPEMILLMGRVLDPTKQ